MKLLSSINQVQDVVNKEYIDGLLADYTAGKATQLATARKIWGQSFDGTKDITGEAIFGSHIKTEGQIVGIHSTGTYERFAIKQNTNGTFFQAGVNDGTAQEGTMYLSGINNTMMEALHIRADSTLIYGSLRVMYGLLMAQSGIMITPNQSLRFQDAATETFDVSFNSEAGGLNFSGNTLTKGLASFSKGIQIEAGQALTFVDSGGVKHQMVYDEEAGALKVIGDFFATGENAGGEVGEPDVDEPNVDISNGVYIQHINGSLYTIDQWTAEGFASDKANGVAVVDDRAKFVVAKTDMNTLTLWASDTSNIISGVTVASSRDEAYLDYRGAENTALIAAVSTGGAAYKCANFTFPDGSKGYLPAAGELNVARDYWDEIDAAMELIDGEEMAANSGVYYWSSTQAAAATAWNYQWNGESNGVSMGVGYILSKEKTNSIRPFTSLSV